MNFPGVPPLTGGSFPAPPNSGFKPRGDEASTAPLNMTGSMVHGYNQSDPGDHRGGTMPLAGQPSPIDPPNANPAPVGHSSMSTPS
jgi:hypothetical protein